jgi:hypothetical protein
LLVLSLFQTKSEVAFSALNGPGENSSLPAAALDRELRASTDTMESQIMRSVHLRPKLTAGGGRPQGIESTAGIADWKGATLGADAQG